MKIPLQSLGFGPRIGQRFADREAMVLRRRVQGGDVQPAACRDDKDEGPVRIHRLACGRERLGCEEARDRPARQPD